MFDILRLSRIQFRRAVFNSFRLNRQIRTLIGVLAVTAVVGCKAKPAPSAGFADPTLMTNDPNIPYNKYWQKPGFDWKSYDKIYIAEVNTSYMMKMTDWQEGERKPEIQQDVHTVAVYARDSLIKAIRADPKHHFQVLDSPTKDPKTLIFEGALIQLIPSKVSLNLLGYAPFYIGTGITVVRTIADDKSYVAFEARMRDAATGEVVVLAADREGEQYAPLDVRGLTWYSDAEGIIDEWSKEFVLISNGKPKEKIEGSPTFRLLPW